MRYILESALIIIVFILALLCFDLNGELTDLKPENRELSDIPMIDMTLKLLYDDLKLRSYPNVKYLTIPEDSNKLAAKILISLGVFSDDSSFHNKENISEHDYTNKLKKYYLLNNVCDLHYQLFFCENYSNPYKIPTFNIESIFPDYSKPDSLISGMTFKGDNGLNWKFIESRRITLDTAEAYDYINKNLTLPENFIPKYPLDKQVMIGNKSDSLLYYSTKYNELINWEGHDELGERIFELNFKLPKRPGWYLIHLTSKSNRILAIINESDYLDKELLNIGNVKVRIKDVELIFEYLLKKLKQYNVPYYINPKDSSINYCHYDEWSNSIHKAEANPNDLRLVNLYYRLLESYQMINLYQLRYPPSGRLSYYYIHVN